MFGQVPAFTLRVPHKCGHACCWGLLELSLGCVSWGHGRWHGWRASARALGFQDVLKRQHPRRRGPCDTRRQICRRIQSGCEGFLALQAERETHTRPVYLRKRGQATAALKQRSWRRCKSSRGCVIVKQATHEARQPGVGTICTIATQTGLVLASCPLRCTCRYKCGRRDTAI